MQMSNPLAELTTAIVSYVTERGGYITKTKLLKLLYLFDVEFYRAHGKTFTGFQWKYFHLGPWTREFDPLLEGLVARGTLIEQQIERPDYDAKFLRSTEPAGLRGTFVNFKDELILRNVLDLWGQSPTSEILDYVYFRTEPMEYGIRNEPLDFSRVLQQLPDTYKRPASKATAGEIKAMRREFSRNVAEKLPSKPFEFTEPKYDEEFLAAMEKLDTGNV
jgi:hypothetical protein